jgi:transcription antitermination factor NusG
VREGEIAQWFAFRVRPRHEKSVALALREKGYREFLPLLKERRKWGARVQSVEVPMFPGYIFCLAEACALVPVLSTPGVVDVIRCGRTPLPAARQEIEALQRAVANHFAMQPWPYTNVGQSVKIATGPLAGVTGILLRVRHSQQLVLSVELLQRSVLVEVATDAVLSLEQPRISELGLGDEGKVGGYVSG